MGGHGREALNLIKLYEAAIGRAGTIIWNGSDAVYLNSKNLQVAPKRWHRLWQKATERGAITIVGGGVNSHCG
jgi:3-phosphoglycerate kinase